MNYGNCSTCQLPMALKLSSSATVFRAVFSESIAPSCAQNVSPNHSTVGNNGNLSRLPHVQAIIGLFWKSVTYVQSQSHGLGAVLAIVAAAQTGAKLPQAAYLIQTLFFRG